MWAAPGRDSKTVLAFFDALGQERCKQLELISADMAAWIAAPITERAPQAERRVDPFHVVMLATGALDQVRREVWNDARRQGNMQLARDLKGARFAVWKNPENLTDRQRSKMSMIQKTNARLYRAYLLKEQLRQNLPRWLRPGREAPGRLAGVGPTIQAAVVREARPHDHRAARRDPRRDQHGLSNARIEQINTQIRLIARRAFGFRSPAPLIALAMLKLAGPCPPVPQ